MLLWHKIGKIAMFKHYRRSMQHDQNDASLYRLLTSLEDESRCVVDIRASTSDQTPQNELVFDIHCTTVNEVLNLHEQLSNSDTELPQLLLNVLDTLADFNSLTVKVEKHEDSEPIPDINDFKICIRRKSSDAKVRLAFLSGNCYQLCLLNNNVTYPEMSDTQQFVITYPKGLV